eukprot:scpid113786/ scgid32864/ 
MKRKGRGRGGYAECRVHNLLDYKHILGAYSKSTAPHDALSLYETHPCRADSWRLNQIIHYTGICVLVPTAFTSERITHSPYTSADGYSTQLLCFLGCTTAAVR